MDGAETLARQIADTFGTKPSRQGREWRCHCPVHEGDGGRHKPSLAIWPTSEKGYAVKCMTGCDKSLVWAALRQRGIKSPQRGGTSAEDRLRHAAWKEQHRVEQLQKVRDMLDTAEPLDRSGLASETPVAIYLAGRGIDLSYDPPKVSTLFDVEDPLFAGAPAFASVICDPTTLEDERPRVVGATILSLLPSGKPRIGLTSGKKLRSIIGVSKGFGVPYGKPESTLVVAEGVESMLAARQLLGIPFGIATLAAPNMPFLAVPEWVSEVVLAADNDTPGMEAAASLATDLGRSGIRVTIERWGDANSGWDAADELAQVKGLK